MAGSKTAEVMRSLRRGAPGAPQTPIATDIYIPNHSGEHDAGRVNRTPTEDKQLVNKVYVDDEIQAQLNAQAWLQSVNQTGLTGDKSGSFDLTTTGKGTFGEVEVDDVLINNAKISFPRGTGGDASIESVGAVAELVLTSGFGGSTSGGITLEMITSNHKIELSPTGTEITDNLIVNQKTKLTAEGGFAVLMINFSGSTLPKGTIVTPFTGGVVNDTFNINPSNGLFPIGVLESSIINGASGWVIMSGIADTLIDAGGCARGDRMITSATAGSADVNNAPSVAVHFQEIGHCVETRIGAGLARLVLHFN